ncbi:putative wax ester synthase/diacylglycerol acyltransferase [Nitzschia inconspicua]|uniref:Wax ester synthase/diacylglycerol acyltransferase n=1 Tax=Nitzschia inconspicua TaxID=303405 RepID=A0A9K3L9V6_9STRA|nr:putative wax ester synthase/diacylglycerol acyltransferase [Nitzschia inconspicua]
MALFASRTLFLGAKNSALAAVGACAASAGFWMATSSAPKSTTSSCESTTNTSQIPRPLPKTSKLPESQMQTGIVRRMTNVGRFSLLSETQSNPSIPVMVLAMTGKPFKPQDFVKLYTNRQVAEKHPRFTAHLDARRNNFVFPSQSQDPLSASSNFSLPHVQQVLYPIIPRTELKDRINDAIKDPLDLDIRLWEARTATGGAIGQSGAIPNERIAFIEKQNNQADVESLLFFRAHHCMADGVSLGALFGDLMDEGDEMQERILFEIAKFKSRRKKTSFWKKMLYFFYYWLWGSVQAIGYQLFLYLVSWTLNRRNPWYILQRAYLERKGLKPEEGIYEPRSLSWMQITSVDEAKQVAEFYSKQTKSRVTINDVFCSCVSAAIVKLLRYHRTVNPWLKDNLELPYMNLVIPVHINGGILLPGQSMGNKIGAMVSRIPCESGIQDSEYPAEVAQQRLQRISEILTKRKQTPAAFLAYITASMMGFWTSSGSGVHSLADEEDISRSPTSSWTSWLFEKAHANASVVVTNVRGPDQMMHLDGRPVQTTLGFLPLPPGIPLGVVVSSYNQQISLTVTAEPWAVPDADQFLLWAQEEFQILKAQMDDPIDNTQ